MKTIEEYHRLAQEKLDDLFRPPTSYFTSDLVNTAMQLMLLDAMEELKHQVPWDLRNAFPVQFDAEGRLLVRTRDE